MSKKIKKANQDRRKNEKHNRKVAQKAKYASFRDKGQNEKSKRVRVAAEKHIKMRAHSHPHGNCGNLGCKLCYPQHNSGVEPGTFQQLILHHFYPTGY